MRTWQPGALFGENEQKSVKMRAKPVRKRERRRIRRKKTHGSLSFCSPRGYADHLAAPQTKL